MAGLVEIGELFELVDFGDVAHDIAADIHMVVA